MVAEASRTLTGVRFPQTMQENEAIRMVGDIEGRMILVAALSVTVECAACGGIGKVRQLRGPTPAVEIHPCLSCDGTGQRLAIKEMLDE